MDHNVQPPKALNNGLDHRLICSLISNVCQSDHRAPASSLYLLNDTLSLTERGPRIDSNSCAITRQAQTNLTSNTPRASRNESDLTG
jgi:hypothetical protein